MGASDLRSDAKDLPRVPASGQAQGDQRIVAGTSGMGMGTNGAFFGITGEERQWLLRAWLLGVCLIGCICIVNILTIHHDSPDLGPIRPIIWEVSSALITTVIFTIPAAMAFWTSRSRPRWWIAAPAHLAALVAYSALHVAGFLVLREWAHAAFLNEAYNYGPLSTEFPYEFRKDFLAYLIASGIFWLALQRGGQAPDAMGPARPATFDIQDGARLTRVAVDKIIAVRSAGNYVEFILADERRPLMRSSLTAMQDALAPQGFVRTHRSWLVNRALVTGLRPEGSGDYTIELGALEAPLSRRFPEALAALRDPA
ncbi:LytTR family DNA-binding domain-containing protein [Caulobacter sp. SL161]|uniref:LytTR family DNA-binding domain-containing protein n=1 Tax=Caulobacter sp. SL161 TaxID=2995156 RepID=UPI0022730519|nr:LytTR family DNA-binding domain-containing protein [Caulobacter sp. SL161]MCY1647619.1 LytTR family DNA-binding domain-containing protein [Caulobacter sp. SL161]